MSVPGIIAEKVQPQSIEAETSVLGAMLMDKEAICKAVETLSEDAFYKTAHRKIYSAIIDLFDKNEPVDLVTLTDKLKKKGELTNIGGAIYLTTILNSVPTAANVEYYIKIVKEKAMLRELIKLNMGIITKAYQPVESVDSLIESFGKEMLGIIQKSDDSSVVRIGDRLHNTFTEIENLYGGKNRITGLSSGYTDLDMLTCGFQPSNLIVIAGRTSMGKTSLSTGIAIHSALIEHNPVLIFSLEMNLSQIVERILCTVARVDSQKIRTGYLGESDWPRLTTAAGSLGEAPIFIDDTPAISISKLKARAMKYKNLYDIKLIIVDYLQLIQGTVIKGRNREQEISEISQSLKSLARELNIPVIALSQLSREVERRTNKRPVLSDLRES